MVQLQLWQEQAFNIWTVRLKINFQAADGERARLDGCVCWNYASKINRRLYFFFALLLKKNWIPSDVSECHRAAGCHLLSHVEWTELKRSRSSTARILPYLKKVNWLDKNSLSTAYFRRIFITKVTFYIIRTKDHINIIKLLLSHYMLSRVNSPCRGKNTSPP